MPFSFEVPLAAGETILFRTRQHWTAVTRFFVFAGVLVMLGLVLTLVMFSIDAPARPFSPMWGVACILAGVGVVYLGKLTRGIHQYVLTNQRLIVKTPLTTTAMYLANVQAVSSRKSLFGNYGWIFIANAGAREGLARVEKCDELALLMQQQIAQRQFAATAVPGSPQK